MNSKEVIDTTQMADPEGSDPSDEEHDPQIDESAPSGSKPKKKKKKSKAARALAALKGKDNIPQEIVDEVLQRVKQEHGEDAQGADEETVRKALDYLKINDVIKGKAGLAGRGRKDLGEHKVCLELNLFWRTYLTK